MREKSVFLFDHGIRGEFFVVPGLCTASRGTAKCPNEEPQDWRHFPSGWSDRIYWNRIPSGAEFAVKHINEKGHLSRTRHPVGTSGTSWRS